MTQSNHSSHRQLASQSCHGDTQQPLHGVTDQVAGICMLGAGPQLHATVCHYWHLLIRAVKLSVIHVRAWGPIYQPFRSPLTAAILQTTIQFPAVSETLANRLSPQMNSPRRLSPANAGDVATIDGMLLTWQRFQWSSIFCMAGAKNNGAGRESFLQVTHQVIHIHT